MESLSELLVLSRGARAGVAGLNHTPLNTSCRYVLGTSFLECGVPFAYCPPLWGISRNSEIGKGPFNTPLNVQTSPLAGPPFWDLFAKTC